METELGEFFIEIKIMHFELRTNFQNLVKLPVRQQSCNFSIVLVYTFWI